MSDAVDKLKAEAEELERQVDAKINDPSYTFTEGTGENTIKSLISCADRLAAAGIDFGERRLRCLAEVVAERSDE